MLKYFFYLLLFILLLDCGNGSQRNSPYPRTPGTPNPNINQPGQCFHGYMKDIQSGNYELFLADSPQFGCGKTRGEWLVNKEIYGGSIACKNWTGTPNIEITFDLQFTRVQTLQITPRGSGGSFTGNYGQLGIPGIFHANAPINPQNEDEGWNATIRPTGYYTQTGNIELYCEHCDFSKNRDMSIEVLYRNRPIGTLLVNPQSTVAQCQPITPAHTAPYPHAYQR